MGLFILIAVIGFLFFAVSAMFGDHDVGHDVSHDVGHDGAADHGEAGPSAFSIYCVSWTMMGFGAVGAIGMYYKFGAPASTMMGAAGGALLWVCSFSLMRLMYKQQASSTLTTSKILGTKGIVTVAIPKGGIGKIQCTIFGGNEELLAKSALMEELSAGTQIEVVSSAGNMYIVKRAS